MPGIFISYRRADSPDATGRIYDRLVAEFGRALVFKDIDSIPLGRDFRSHLNEVVGDCAAVLAIVGPHWTDMRDEADQRRLEDPDDFVRIELEAALARNIPVVPVLVGHATMPGSAHLPASLAQLAFRQSIEVRPDPDFHHDSTRLVSALRQILDPSAPVDASPVGTARTAAPAQGEPRSRRLAWTIATIAVLAMLATLLPALKHLREVPPPQMRVDIVTPASGILSGFALSPDGRQIVFEATGDGVSRLWLRSLDTTAAVPLAGTEGATYPFWSPDGRSIGFHDGSALKRLDLGGGAPQTLAPDVSSRGGTWNENGVILFSPAIRGTGLMRVSVSGGAVEAVTTLGPNQTGHDWPYFLPDGRHFLYLALGAPDTAGIYLGVLDGGVPVRLTASSKAGVYLPSGWLLWVRERTLVAQRLELSKGELSGSPLTLVQDLGLPVSDVSGSPVSVALTGMIAYRAAAGGYRRLVWFDRSGAVRGAFGGAEGDDSMAPRISPDGRRVVVSRDGDIWLLDGTRSTRFTFDASKENGSAIWSPDGTRIAWADSAGINRKLASGAGTTEQLIASAQETTILNSWSPDGRFLIYHAIDAVTGGDLWVLPMVGDHTPSAFLKTRANERSAAFSPDGRWVAYYSDESGRYEIYVRPFVPPGLAGATPDAGVSKWQVSTAGGINPTWRPDGKEIYYLNPAGVMMAVPISDRGKTLEAGAPVDLFPTRTLSGGVGSQQFFGRQYDLAPDGRFLVNSLPDAGSNTSITLLQNWSPEDK